MDAGMISEPSGSKRYYYFTLDYALLQQQQFDDLPLQHAHDTQPNKFPIHDFGEVQLVCYVSNPADPWRIVIPTQALNNMV